MKNDVSLKNFRRTHPTQCTSDYGRAYEPGAGASRAARTKGVVLYFNPWLNIPDTLREQYQNLIGMANRANISFYTVDTKGLVTWSQNDAGRDMMK